ncbi:MAG: hypothetical protein IT371_18775 [Deltaproteobacteria bacterium]|nr:hypothetical protein [Deltaproteobacteria bacterium]
MNRIQHLVTTTAFLAALASSGSAAAKATRSLDWSFSAIWSSTIRLLRVDRGYKVTDKDKENGFILFVFPGAGAVKECAANLEIIPVTDEHGYRRIRLQLAIAHQPSYIEVQLLDDLERKLQEEHGRPPPPKRKEPEQKPKPPAPKPAPSPSDEVSVTRLEHRARLRHDASRQTRPPA